MAESTLIIEAPAKVNLCLSVHHPPLESGYHLLDSVFQALDLHDTLRFECLERVSRPEYTTASGTALGIEGIDSVPTENNLITKAIDAAEQAFDMPMVTSDCELRVHVEKNIPTGGGLGGGSSDAAAALLAFCTWKGIDPESEKVIEIASGLGADVAVFLYGGCALMSGRGEKLVRKLPTPDLALALILSDEGNSTAAVYRQFDEHPQPAPCAEALARAIEAGEDAADIAALCENNLSKAAFVGRDDLAARVAHSNADPRVLKALVTGSGATVYAIFADVAAAESFIETMEARGRKAIIARSISTGVRVL